MRRTTLLKLIAVAVVLANLVMYVQMGTTGRASFGLFLLLQTAGNVALLLFCTVPMRPAPASALGDTAYRRLNYSAELDAGGREQAEAYISPANIAATAEAIQPTEDGRELTDHGLILTVLAALRGAHNQQRRAVLTHVVCEMAYRFAHDSGMQERDRWGILAERRVATNLDADGMMWPTQRHMDKANRAKAEFEARRKLTPHVSGAAAEALLAARPYDPQTDYAGVGEALHNAVMNPPPPAFNPNSPAARDALHAAADRPDPRDMGDALAYAFVGFDPAKPGTDQTVRHLFIAPTASGLTDAELDQLVKSGHGQIIEHVPSHVTPLAAGTALHLFAAERSRQIQAEGYSPDKDDGYVNGHLARAAATYALPNQQRLESPYTYHTDEGKHVPCMWPWGAKSWKPTPNDRLREVVKAGALLLAEAERLIRANITTTEPVPPQRAAEQWTPEEIRAASFNPDAQEHQINRIEPQ